MGIRRTAPVTSPVDIESMVQHLRLEPIENPDEGAQYDLLQSFIDAATDHVRNMTNSEPGIAAPYELTLDQFPAAGVIMLPLPPVIAVQSVKYRDIWGQTQTLSPD